MKPGKIRDRISAKFNGALYFEMEAAGLPVMDTFPIERVHSKPCIQKPIHSCISPSFIPFSHSCIHSYALSFIDAVVPFYHAIEASIEAPFT
jgi:hypothetical protein